MPAAMPKAMSAMSSTRGSPKTNTPYCSHEYTNACIVVVIQMMVDELLSVCLMRRRGHDCFF